MASQLPERRLAAIMFTDIVGYAALMEESEARGLLARERHRSLLGLLAERFAGEVVDENGDELVLSFPSALNAVHCALAAQDELRGDAELQLRIGIHLGDVIFADGRIYGDGVNVASRIRPLAQPGGICVSDEVHRSIRNQEDIEAFPLGPQQLKNVTQPIEVYAVGRPGTVSVPTPSPETPLLKRFLAAVALAALFALGVWGWNRTVLAPRPADPIRSIAVLPLENLSGDPEQEYFADGMTEALIGDLARLRALSVISRTSVMRYKETDKPLPEIAAELDVDGIVEGSVMRAGHRVRITVQLIDARSDHHVWSDRYDRDLSNVLILQSDVARAVAEQVRIELTTTEQAALMTRHAVDPRAYEAYLRGLQLQGAGPDVGNWGPRAIGHFERAVELDPEFAEAYVALARARYLLGYAGQSPNQRVELPKAREAAERALALDETLGSAHAVVGWVRLWYDWDWSGAAASHERAWLLSPNDPEVVNARAQQLFMQGRRDEALAVSERLLILAPFDALHRSRRAYHLYLAREFQAAVDEFERVRKLFPDFFDPNLAMNYVELGRFEDAHRQFMAMAQRCGSRCDFWRTARERGWAEGGWEGSQRAFLDVMAANRSFAPSAIALPCIDLEETDLALAWLERAYTERDPMLPLIGFQPHFDPLRSDPRFRDLLRRIGFPEESQSGLPRRPS